ncbi:MAG TPA: helix-turn-helix transcriptional regulator [Fimbriiglobus sp.]|nr:helix-turn-helix transcriptional regulator [Fimbriiglobus sp.]
MSVRREYRKTGRTPEQLAELRAVRERYQREKPSPEQALAASGQTDFLPLGEVVLLRQIATELKRERERKGMTLAELSSRCGIDQAALSRLENGKVDNPTIDTLYRVAAALDKVVCCVLRDAPPACPA